MSRPELRGGPLQAGVGMGWRPELAGGLMTAPQQVDWLEVVAESCMAPGPTRREILALSEIWPVVPHGVKLSLGSADGIELERARRLGRLARELRAPCITEHVAFTRAGGREIGHLTQLPFTRAALAVLARNVDAARRVLPDVPLLLENAAWTLRWPDDELAEGDFYYEVAARTGCRLLLDLGNVYANARNSGTDPLALLRSYPLERIGMIHLAGGSLRGGFYIDTHADPVPAPVLALLAEALRCCGPLPVLIERDACFPPFAETAAELHTVRAVLEEAAAGRPAVAQDPRARAPLVEDPAARGRLAQDQAALCTQLLAPQPADVAADRAPRFDPAAIRAPAPGKTNAFLADTPLKAWILFLHHVTKPGGRITLIGEEDARAARARGEEGDAVVDPGREVRALVGARRRIERPAEHDGNRRDHKGAARDASAAPAEAGARRTRAARAHGDPRGRSLAVAATKVSGEGHGGGRPLLSGRRSGPRDRRSGRDRPRRWLYGRCAGRCTRRRSSSPCRPCSTDRSGTRPSRAGARRSGP